MQTQSVRIIRAKEVSNKSGLSRPSIYRGAKEGWFPKPVKISEVSTGWIESEVDAYIAARIAERDANRRTRNVSTYGNAEVRTA